MTVENKMKMNDQLYALAALIPGIYLMTPPDRRLHRIQNCLRVVVQSKISVPDRTSAVVNYLTNSTIPVILPYKSFLYLCKLL